MKRTLQQLSMVLVKLLTQGPNISAFEEAVAERVGANHGVAVATETAALHCACYASGVGPGDKYKLRHPSPSPPAVIVRFIWGQR